MKALIFLFGTLVFAAGCGNSPEPAVAAETSEITKAAPDKAGEGCFENRLPDGSVLTFRFNQRGNRVEGVLDYTFAEKDGAHGTFAGNRDGDIIRALWTYTVEGSQQSEQIMVRIEEKQAVKASGELVEGPNGVLELKDPEKATWAEVFPRVACK
jgi:hypothetical protein